MDELQAAVLRAKLPYLDGWNARRRAISARYDSAFGIARRSSDTDFVAHLYVLRSAARDLLRERLAAAGIGTDIHYPVPDYRQPSLAVQCTLPVTEVLCREVLTLPLFPELTDSEVDSVIQTVLETGLVRGESY